MANVGSANLRIVPKFDGLSSAVNKALSAIDTTSSGRAMGQGVANGVEDGAAGLKGSAALMGVFSAMTTKALDLVSSHVGSAVSRLDTLKNYPQVMQSLGVSSDEAQSSIQTMSDRLSNLPTTLDAMSSTVQGLYAATKDYGVSLTTATDAGLALNDMLLAGGQGTAVVNSAMEQFRQMLSKGKPDMQDWKALLSAAPGQMDQLAKSMLGPTANANDLYAALGGGGAEATVSMEQLLDAIIEVDKTGGAGLDSFKDQAEKATGGIQTAAENMGNAITKGITNAMDAIGRENIVGVFNDIKGGINEAFKVVNGAAGPAVTIFNELWGAAKRLAPAVGAVATGFLAWRGITGIMSGLSAGASVLSGVASGASNALLTLATHAGGRLQDGLLSAAGGASNLAGVLSGPFGVGITAAVAGIGLLVNDIMDEVEAQEEARAATEAFHDAVAQSAELAGYSEVLNDVGEHAEFSAMSIDELNDAWNKHADAITRNNDEAEDTIAKWTTVKQTFDELAGKTELTTSEQGKLNWALEQFNDATGLAIDANDVLTGQYEDQEGNVHSLKEAVDELVQARINEARTTALTNDLTEAYEAQGEASKAAAEAQANWNDAYDIALDYATKHKDALNGQTVEAYAAQAANAKYGDDLATTTQRLDDANTAVDNYSEALGTATQAASEGSNAYLTFVTSNGYMSAALQQAGVDVNDFAYKLRDLGVDTTALADLSHEDMTRLASSYHGSADDIVAALQGMGEQGQAVLATMGDNADAASARVDDMKAHLSSWGDVSGALDALGVDMDTLCSALDNAGITADSMTNMTASDFTAMAQSCNGDLDGFIAKIGETNNTPLDSKEATAVVEGNAVNGSARTAVNNTTGAVRSMISRAIDAIVNGNAGNGSAESAVRNTASAINGMHGRDVSANVFGNAMHVAGDIWDTVSAIGSLFSKDVTVTTTYKTYRKEMAAGGIILKHAAGAIYTRPTMVDAHNMIGEDGAEYYDGSNVVPLTNRKYSQPFADVIAEGIVDRLGSSNDAQVLVGWLEQNLGPIIEAYAPVATARETERRMRKVVALG